MHGFESVVGPVKGVFDKETSLNKAREHSLLRSDRPAYVTILSLGAPPPPPPPPSKGWRVSSRKLCSGDTEGGLLPRELQGILVFFPDSVLKFTFL
jgi:hypothetical protein